LEIAANNIANVSTTGYRGQIASFESQLVQTAGPRMDGWERLVNQQAVLHGSRLDLGEGNLQRTGNPLDLAIEGPGFFVVQTKAGTLYTRNGNLRISSSGQLATGNGDPVLGMSGPLNVPADGSVDISADGTVSANGAVVGKLQIAEFAGNTQLQPAGSTYYSAPKGAAKTAIASSLRQGTLEASNVNPVGAMVSLISAERQAEMVERALSTFYSDFNRIAVDELPRT
jgi:flagellar basal-body rod protein FlgF/flagellar basal-body rod protein FlgG